MEELIRFPFPVFIAREGKWFVAECPILGIATQGKTDKEVRENMRDLIREYFSDPDTNKVKWQDLDSSFFTYISASIPKKFLHGKTQAVASR